VSYVIGKEVIRMKAIVEEVLTKKAARNEESLSALAVQSGEEFNPWA
jgi:hypothetical protein